MLSTASPKKQPPNTNLMEQLNKVELCGVVGTARTHTVGNTLVARFSLATNFASMDAQGFPIIETTWHSVTAWEGERCRNLSSITKGSHVYVQGRLRCQKYIGTDGFERSCFEVVAQEVKLLDD